MVSGFPQGKFLEMNLDYVVASVPLLQRTMLDGKVYTPLKLILV
jgi:hypothetical protein